MIPKSKAQNQNNSKLSNMSKEAMDQSKKQTNPMRILKHQLPGNNTLSEKEQSKLGVRKNRYGSYQQSNPTDFDIVVKKQLSRGLLSDKKGADVSDEDDEA